jgi:outer membrane lipoprotein carrier protein
MLSNRSKFTVAVCLMAILNGGSACSQDVAAIAHAVDVRYNHLRTLRAEFTEIYSGAGTERTESGYLFLKKPGKMRWEYRSPREKVFLSDGKHAWFYVSGEKLAREISTKQLEDLRSPLAFLLGKSELQKELKGLSVAADVKPLEAGNTVLRGVPEAMQPRLTEIVLEITPINQISRLLLEGVDGSVTEYRFSAQEENVPIAEGQFKFVAPAGVELIDGYLAQ